MDRIQRALDLAKLQRSQDTFERGQDTFAEEDPRIERAAFTREFALSVVESRGVFSLDRNKLEQYRVISADEDQPAGRAYRMLRTQILQTSRAHNLTTLGIVSAVNGEGKTLTAINLALGLAAEPNQTVILADLDLRRPAVAHTLGLRPERGLEAWFSGDEPTKNVCYGIQGVERLYVLPTLSPVPGSSEILAGLGTRRLLNDLKGRDRDPGRLILVDLPPVLLSDDALTIAPLLDAVVLVASERRTRREDIVRVMELLKNTRVLGTVLNCSTESEQRAY